MRCFLLLTWLFGAAFPAMLRADDRPLSLATFQVDATPPIGSPLCGSAVAPAEKIVDPLSARGVVLLGGDAPIVLCAVDWVGIGNAGLVAWRTELAEAAGTTIDRVAVHTLHQHDAPFCDFTAERLAAEHGLAGRIFDEAFARRTISRAAEAVRKSLAQARPITHVAVGQAKVSEVASNRRILGPDGKVKSMRYSSCVDEMIRAEPEGVIDPLVRLVAWFDGDRPVASITYYATHPQSYYGEGGVSADFVGMARAEREKQLPDVAHIHFNGAAGNLAAGKYNDGSPKMRPILAERLARGMQAAWEDAQQHRRPVTSGDIEWRSVEVSLPVRKSLDAQQLLATLENSQAAELSRIHAALHLAWLRRAIAGERITIGCLRLGTICVLHMPGELFVEYQLAAQKMRPDATVCMAAYGDYGPGYIGTQIAYGQGGYETGDASRTAPEVETVLTGAMRELLGVKSAARIDVDLSQGELRQLAPDDRGRLRLERGAEGYLGEGEMLSGVVDRGQSGAARVNWIEQWTAPVRWKKHDGNPIYGPKQSGEWDTWTNGVSIVRSADDSTYRMYYSGRKGAGIGFAEGSVDDPLRWKEHPASPVLRPLNNWEGNLINQPRVVKVTDTHWRMYYTGWGLKQPGSSWAMGLAETFDGGLTWKRHGTEPLIPRGDESSPDGGGVFVPSLLRVDGRWMMWYTAMMRNAGRQNIHLCLATSDDGVNWEKYPHNPVLTDDFSKGPSRNVISRCFVRHDDGVFRLWYSHAKPQYRIQYAESLDGIAWERWEHGPVLDTSPKPAWDDEMVEYPEIDLVDGVYRMWFCGNGFGTVGYAEGIRESGISLEVRSGDTPKPASEWSEWAEVRRDRTIPLARFVQLRARLWTKNDRLSPALNSLRIEPVAARP